MSSLVNRVSACEVCGEQHLISVLDLGEHPLCDDLVRIGEERMCREYPIEVVLCNTCLTGHQRFQVAKRELFPESYHYRARFTADVLNGMAGLVDSCERKFGQVAGQLVLDVGCNDGSLLSFFRGKGAKTIGVEPTGAFRDAERQGHITYNAFFDETLARDIERVHGRPDFITFTNVFAHVEDLQAVLRSLRILMAPHTIIVVENHYLGAVIEGNQFDTFYHEHPRSYSYTSFAYIARLLEVPLTQVEFPSRYGGNIRVFMGGARRPRDLAIDTEDLSGRERRFPEQFSMLRANVERWRESRREFVLELVRRHGRLRAKAFPARAAILIKLLGLDCESISAVYEKPGSMKIGHYVPGTRVPILSDADLFALPRDSAPLLNLAWHIPQEIRGYLLQSGYTGPVVDIVDRTDFP